MELLILERSRPRVIATSFCGCPRSECIFRAVRFSPGVILGGFLAFELPVLTERVLCFTADLPAMSALATQTGRDTETRMQTATYVSTKSRWIISNGTQSDNQFLSGMPVFFSCVGACMCSSLFVCLVETQSGHVVFVQENVTNPHSCRKTNRQWKQSPTRTSKAAPPHPPISMLKASSTRCGQRPRPRRDFTGGVISCRTPPVCKLSRAENKTTLKFGRGAFFLQAFGNHWRSYFLPESGWLVPLSLA